MKKLFAPALLAFLAACGSNEPAKTDTATTAADPGSAAAATAPVINSPYAVSYSSQFVSGDPKNAESVLTLWKDWEGGDLSVHKSLFADSVSLTLADGSVMNGPRDSILAGAQSFRNTLASSVSTVDAIMAVKSTDKNENWALVWGKEINKDKKGKIDSVYLQETWRFNKDGKVDLMFQYKQAIKPAKK